ncbi:MAG: ribosome recycling factor [Armatimonadota bacterium]
MEMRELLKETRDKMEQSLAAVRRDFSTVRTGRANPAILDQLKVDYYGTPTPLNQLANVSVPESRLIVIQPYDKSTIPNIEKAVMTSDIDLTPSSDGQVVRLPVPQLSEERREQLSKQVQQKAEDGRIAIRNIRREANQALDDMEKNQGVSEDIIRREKETVQDLTDDYIEKIDEALEKKIEEITEI